MKMVDIVSHNSWLMWLFLLQAMLAGLAKAQVAGEIISRKGNDAEEFKSGPDHGHPDTNGPALAANPKRSLEELRSLLYLYSRLGRPTMVEAVAGRILNRNPRDKETLRLLASFYLQRRDAPRALANSRSLVKFYSGDAQAHFLLAMAYKLNEEYRLAKEVLTKVKSEKFPKGFFPYEGELASAALLSGDWPQAVRSYQAALENPTLQTDERREMQNQLDQLYRTHLPQLFFKETATHFQAGLIFRSALEWSQPLAANHRLHLELEHDDLKLNGTDLLQAQWAHRYDVLAGIESDLYRWHTKVFGGIGDEGAVYGANLTRVLGDEKNLTLAPRGNQRATDSLLLETLHGREDELSLIWHTRLYPDIHANLTVGGRRILVGGDTLGYGYNASLDIERIVLKNVPELHLGYRGLITGYSQSSENFQLVTGVAAPGTSGADRLLLLNDLVSPINLHGFYLSWQQTINPSWSWRALAGSDYSFIRCSPGYTLETGLSYCPSRRTEFVFSAGYSTSASTSDQNSERFESSLALRYRF